MRSVEGTFDGAIVMGRPRGAGREKAKLLQPLNKIGDECDEKLHRPECDQSKFE
jgi:hypothetical protein